MVVNGSTLKTTTFDLSAEKRRQRAETPSRSCTTKTNSCPSKSNEDHVEQSLTVAGLLEARHDVCHWLWTKARDGPRERSERRMWQLCDVRARQDLRTHMTARASDVRRRDRAACSARDLRWKARGRRARLFFSRR